MSLLGNGFLDQVTNRQQPDQLAILHHRQMAQTFVGHDAQARVDGLVRIDGDHRRDHDVAHRRTHRRTAMQHQLTGVIALTDDAQHFIVLHHQQGPDVFLGHLHQRFEHHVIRFDLVHFLIFLIFELEQLGDGLHGGYSGVVVVIQAS